MKGREPDKEKDRKDNKDSGKGKNKKSDRKKIEEKDNNLLIRKLNKTKKYNKIIKVKTMTSTINN